MDGRLFFIALLPDEAIQAEITRFKLYASRHFNSSRARGSPPHITRLPPFSWPEETLPRLEDSLSAFAAGEKGFSQALRHFDCFRPRVVFVDVVRNDALWGLQARLELRLRAELGLEQKNAHPFHPHVTVAFKDLKRQAFEGAWAYFSAIEYERQFEATEICLLEHDGRQWQVSGKYALGPLS